MHQIVNVLLAWLIAFALLFPGNNKYIVMLLACVPSRETLHASRELKLAIFHFVVNAWCCHL